MRAPESHDLQLPTQTVANATFPYADRFAAAREFLAQRGIAEPRPLYGARARSVKLSERLAASAGVPALACRV
jgi:hypothetical protein